MFLKDETKRKKFQEKRFSNSHLDVTTQSHLMLNVNIHFDISETVRQLLIVSFAPNRNEFLSLSLSRYP